MPLTSALSTTPINGCGSLRRVQSHSAFPPKAAAAVARHGRHRHSMRRHRRCSPYKRAFASCREAPNTTVAIGTHAQYSCPHTRTSTGHVGASATACACAQCGTCAVRHAMCAVSARTSPCTPQRSPVVDQADRSRSHHNRRAARIRLFETWSKANQPRLPNDGARCGCQ